MESCKICFFIGVIVCLTFSGFSNVQAKRTTAPVPSASASSPTDAPSPSDAPSPANDASSPTDAPSPTTAEAPVADEINIDFSSVSNVADLVPKLDNIDKFNFASLKIEKTAKDLCKNTDFNNECLASILPDIEKQDGKAELGTKDVMELQTESLYKKANATLDYAKRMVTDKKTPEETKEAMSVCVENYESLMSSLEEAKAAIAEGDYGTLKSVMSGAISSVSSCSDAFADISGVDSPTKSLDELMKKLLSNILAMSPKPKA